MLTMCTNKKATVYSWNSPHFMRKPVSALKAAPRAAVCVQRKKRLHGDAPNYNIRAVYGRTSHGTGSKRHCKQFSEFASCSGDLRDTNNQSHQQSFSPLEKEMVTFGQNAASVNIETGSTPGSDPELKKRKGSPDDNNKGWHASNQFDKQIK